MRFNTLRWRRHNKNELFLFSVLSVLVNFGLINGFSVGVPPLRSVCLSMNPQHHDYVSQGTESPFEVSASKTEVSGGDNVEFTLKGIDGDKKTRFIGFYVQARDDNDSPIGTWTPNKDTKVHSCGGIRANAAHHASGNVKKDNVTIIWTAPREFQGDVTFTATAVKDFVTYWVYLQTDPVTVKNDPATLASIATVPSASVPPVRRPTSNFNSFNIFRSPTATRDPSQAPLPLGGVVRQIIQNVQDTANRLSQILIPPQFRLGFRFNNNNNTNNASSRSSANSIS